MRTSSRLGLVLTLGGCFSDPTPITSSSSDSTDTTSDLGSTSGASGASDATTIVDSGSTTAASTSDSTGSGQCMAAGGVDKACDASTPFCVDGTCQGCSALPSGCAELDPTAPICDPNTETCGPCNEHDQCESGACRIATGACFADTNRLWVDAGADCAGALGSEAAPFCTIDEALSTIYEQAPPEPWAVFVAGSAVLYDPGGEVPPPMPVAIIGPSAGLEARIGGLLDPVLLITGSDREMYFARVTLVSEANTLLECQQGEVWLDDVVLQDGPNVLEVGVACEVRARRSVFTGAGEHAVVVRSGGVLGLEQSVIRGNSGAILLQGTASIHRSFVFDNYLEGGINVDGGSLFMANSMLWSNVYAIGNLLATSSAQVELLYVTAYADSVACDGAMPTLEVRNSAIQLVECNQASIDNSLVTAAAVGQGQGNVAFPTINAELEDIFVDTLDIDLHLENAPPAWLLGVAVRRASDPPTDIDGDPRPDVDEDDYPGADVP